VNPLDNIAVAVGKLVAALRNHWRPSHDPQPTRTPSVVT